MRLPSLILLVASHRYPVPTKNPTSFQDNDLRRGCEILESSFWLEMRICMKML